MICRNFLPFSSVFFTFLIMSFEAQRFLIMVKSHLSSFSLITLALGVMCKKLPNSKCVCLFPKNFILLAPFWDNFFIWSEVGVQLYSFACDCPFVSAPFVKKSALSLLNCLGPLVKYQLTINVWVYFWTLHYLSLSDICFYICPVFSILQVFIIWLTEVAIRWVLPKMYFLYVKVINEIFQEMPWVLWP